MERSLHVFWYFKNQLIELQEHFARTFFDGHSPLPIAAPKISTDSILTPSMPTPSAAALSISTPSAFEPSMGQGDANLPLDADDGDESARSTRGTPSAFGPQEPSAHPSPPLERDIANKLLLVRLVDGECERIEPLVVLTDAAGYIRPREITLFPAPGSVQVGNAAATPSGPSGRGRPGRKRDNAAATGRHFDGSDASTFVSARRPSAGEVETAASSNRDRYPAAGDGEFVAHRGRYTAPGVLRGAVEGNGRGVASGRVVDARLRFIKRYLDHAHQWQPDPELVARVLRRVVSEPPA